MARVIRLAEAFTDTSLPKLRDDAILTDGSLSLIEPMHPANPWPSGVPATTSTLPNIAAVEAEAVIGSSPGSPTFQKAAAFAGSLGLAERTTKGGLHGIVTQSAWVSGSLLMAILPSTAVYDWLRNNPTHHFFFSLWGRKTRVGLSSSGGPTLGVIARLSSSVVVGPFYMGDTANQVYPASGNRDGARLTDGLPSGAPNTGSTGPFLVNVAGVNPDTAGSSYSSPGSRNYAMWGSNGVSDFSAGSNVNKWASWIFYRSYLEDLTVSGRSYATVDAIDKALQTAHVLTAGGRYYGDTYTAPSTLP